MQQRSACPLNLALEMLGDAWSLLILRDILFDNRRSFRALHAANPEGIASNILAARLRKLVAGGLLSHGPDPQDSRRGRYTLTERAIGLIPVMAALTEWACTCLPASGAQAARMRALHAGGPAVWRALAQELRHLHLDGPPPPRSVLARLNGTQPAARR